jgi:hypothetical protein
MAGSSRYSTKTRAKRIALQYFKRLHPFRRWKLILSIAAPALAALWIVAAASRGDQRLYLGGPVSTAHAMFESECRLCHGPAPRTAVSPASLAAAAAATPSGFFLKVADASCTTCHAGPAHAASETFTPPCASCHIEHLGRAVLVQIADRHCVQCHGNLETKGGRPSPYHRTIPTLAQHPEFAVDVKDAGTVARVRLDKPAEVHDTAQLKLNHVKHLETNLKGVEQLETAFGETAVVKLEGRAQVACTFCHRPDERGQYLQPIAYAQHCAACHPLDFDGRFPDVVVPHDTPPIVRAFLRGTLGEAFDQCQTIPGGEAGSPIRERCVELDLAKAPPTPAAEGDRPRGLRRGGGAEAPPADEPRGRRAGRGEPPAPAGWVAGQMATLERSVFKQRCEYCHTVAREADALPQIVPTAITARWLPHARFDHRAHRPVACGECHRAATSTETRDVLLPSIATCRECHTPHAGARTGCVECHRYHDKSQERSPDGPLKIHQLLDRIGAANRDRIR